MSQLTVQIFSSDLLETFEHYRKAFNATQISLARGSENEPIHLVMDILENHIAIAPLAPHEITKGNVTVICLGFQDKDTLMTAYNVLKEGGQSDGLKELPWSPLQGYVTDKYGVVWCIGL
ncbi:MAG: hypothetical protein FWF92_00490 [Oscillospiraceae bacterium]|nr:hypothetical protein [Oscillospiraceae bacterium]